MFKQKFKKYTIHYLIVAAMVCAHLQILVPEAMAASKKRPNIVVVMVDDMRFDQMSNMNHPYIQTPALDKLTKEGVSFSRAYVTSPVCGPSRASLFTAQMPSNHNRRTNFQSPKSYTPYLLHYLHSNYPLADYMLNIFEKYWKMYWYVLEFHNYTFSGHPALTCLTMF